MRNVGTLDRLLRVILAEVCVLAAFFWLGREWQIVFYLLAAVLLVQAATGVCGFYNFLKWNTCENIKRKDKNLLPIALMVMIVVAVVGSYGSAVLTRDIFLNDLSSIKEPYDLTLQYTSQDLRQESAQQFERLESSFAAFQEKYTDYRPLVVKFDDQFTADVQNLSAIISGSREDIHKGNLKVAHDNLERAKPLLQKMQEHKGLP
ncbi:MAG TPA: DUF2892 domain-containing protein [Methanotrichaceae archaeon]|nr:DUF2892 domain-containing protein [Methanotrichaceae archaeon]